MTAFDKPVPSNSDRDGDAGVDDDTTDDNTSGKDATGRPAMEGGDRERGDLGGGADEAGRRSHQLSQGDLGPTADYGDG